MNAQDYLPGLARISLQAGVLVLLVLLAQWLFRRQLPARWRCALWLLVIVRLLLPFSPGSATSIFNLLPQWASKPPPTAPATFALVPAPRTTALVLAKQVPEPFGLITPTGPPTGNPQAHTATPEPQQETLLPSKTAVAQKAVPPSLAPPTSRLALLFWIWLAGAVILPGYIVVSSLRLAWRCRGLPALSDASALAVLEECGKRLGIRGCLTVVECAEVTSPALFGLFRPRLLLPQGFTQSFSTQELRFVFLHELAHLKRWDLPLNWLVAVLQILHWFNPLVWFGFSRWRLDRELACDALAIEAAGASQHREYGRTILHLLENLTHRAPVPGLVGILEDQRQLRRRIGMTANFRPGNRWGLPSVALLAVLALVGLTDAQTAKTPQSPPPTSIDPYRTEAQILDWSAKTDELKLDAPGYEPLTTEPTNFDLGDQDLEPPLHRTADANELTVLQPDGQPAAGAQLWVRTTGDWGPPWIHAPGGYSSFLLPQKKAGEDGRIKLPETPADARVVIAHTNGFLIAPIAELQPRGEAHLRAYGTVEGRLLVAGKPKSGADVGLRNLTWARSLAFELSYRATTDSDGRFVFTQVPAGEFKLYRLAMPQGLRGGGRRITETYPMPVTINAGQTNKVEYTSTGCVVIGRAVTLPFDLPVNWRDDVHTLSLKLPGTVSSGRPKLRYNAMIDAYLNDNDPEDNDPLFREAQTKQARQVRAYALEFENDGSFRIEDVPPGIYELRIRVTEPDESQPYMPSGNEKELGSLIREIVVPEPLDFGIGKQPLDLGTLTVAMNGLVSAR